MKGGFRERARAFIIPVKSFESEAKHATVNQLYVVNDSGFSVADGFFCRDYLRKRFVCAKEGRKGN